MAIRPYLVVALAVWLTWGAFVGLHASGLPNHVVAGGVLGPGNDMRPGPTNPANAAGIVFYSINQPTFSLLVGADTFTPATGTEPAVFAKDVGVDWNWTAGDNVFGVVETTRGTNGWTDVNYTMSLSASLRVGVTVQDIGDGTLEAFPTIVRTFGTDYVRIQWGALVSLNVTSYHVWTADSPAGPWVSLTTVTQGAAPSHNDTALPAGPHCYTVGVNYRRDLAGSVYETTGRSEPVCATLTGAVPTILSTDPANGASNVAVNVPIVVTFSEAIDTATLLWTVNPSITLVPGWSAGNTVLTFSHGTDFTQCTVYTVTITRARDPEANDLGPGAPNPWTFTSFCLSPYIVSTSPVDGATAVPRATAIRITFSEAMNPATVTVNSVPAPSSRVDTWSGGNTILTITHGGLTSGTLYTLTVAGQDVDGNALVPGPVPNPFDFTVNRPPTAMLTAPGVNVCRTGGGALDITWTMSDTETPTGSLWVWLNYTAGVTTSPILGAQALQSPNSPATFSWTTPSPLDSDVTILLEVRDGAGESVQGISAPVRIDSTRPTVVLTFSEAMDATSAQGAVSFNPPVTGLTFSWDTVNPVLTVGHPVFQSSQQYTVTVGTTARDACTPGLTVQTAYTASFTTGAGARAPNPPTNLVATTQTATAISFTWTAPTTYTDGSALPPSEISGYRVFRATSETGTPTDVGTVTARSFTDVNVVAGQSYWYWVKTIGTSLVESEFSASLAAQAGTAPAPPFNWLVVIIPLIAILLLIGALLLLRRKKPAVTPPAGGAAGQAAPAQAQAQGTAEAEPPEAAEQAEGGDQFIACPNCGTMVKPTDVECFVCGAKL